MAEPVLKSIEIEGFLSIRSATVSLGALNVLIGANGAGKSNLVRAFEFLGRLADGELARFVGQNGGAFVLLHTDHRRMVLSVEGHEITYTAVLAPGVNDELIFEREIVGLEIFGHGDLMGGTPFGTEVPAAGSRVETSLAPGGEGAPGDAVLRLLRGCRVFHFHDTSRQAPMKALGPTADNLVLHNDARNLAAVLLDLRDSGDPAKMVAYRRVVGVVQQVAPFFREFVLVPEGLDQVRLRWRQVGSDTVFSAHQMSDGTLRFICLATLLLQPALPSLVVLDEPELGLHPFAIVIIAELLRQASTRSQVMFATQSVTLISQFELSELIVAERRGGASQFHRPDPEVLAQWLSDYSLGELWEKNLLGGRPVREDRND